MRVIPTGAEVGRTPRPSQTDITDIVLNSAVFDAAWYRSKYPDVATSGLSAEAHYIAVGQWDHRPTSFKEYLQITSVGRVLSKAVRRARPSEALRSALRRAPVVSYCIPIQNRGSDLGSTLRSNLNAISELQSLVEFVVVFFDQDFSLHDRMRREFKDELESGYLRLIVSNELPWWHFCRAKNAFKKYILGEVYSSLDGDNFVSLEETAQIINVHDKLESKFIFHHFSGSWGDGTSGRVSVPAALYKSIGYDAKLLPRQFDEIDLILSTLNLNDEIEFVRYDTQKHALSSNLMRRFLADHPNTLRFTHVVPEPPRHRPVNPRGEDYVSKSSELRTLQRFNQAFSFWKNSIPTKRARLLSDVFKARAEVIDHLPSYRLVPWVISPQTDAQVPEVAESDVCLFTCVRNDEAFLAEFYRHYTNLGVNWFFIVDDGSDLPVSTVLPHSNVFVFKPEAGDFASAKTMWLEALMVTFLQPGTWVLTVDADEFLDVPGFDGLAALIETANAVGSSEIPAVLLDMLPGSTDASHPTGAFAGFNRILADVGRAPLEYRNSKSIGWGFGDLAQLSWEFDARYHAFGTFDSLRKIPLLQYLPGRHLNQGFHDLHSSGSMSGLSASLWARKPILPLRHYKLSKLFDEHKREQMRKLAASTTSVYHERTSSNIAKIFGSEGAKNLEMLRALKSEKYSPECFANRVAGVFSKNALFFGE